MGYFKPDGAGRWYLAALGTVHHYQGLVGSTACWTPPILLIWSVARWKWRGLGGIGEREPPREGAGGGGGATTNDYGCTDVHVRWPETCRRVWMRSLCLNHAVLIMMAPPSAFPCCFPAELLRG